MSNLIRDLYKQLGDAEEKLRTKSVKIINLMYQIGVLEKQVAELEHYRDQHILHKELWHKDTSFEGDL